MPDTRKFSVHWSKNAASDLASIVDYASLESHEVAEQILVRIEESACNLAIFPHRGRIVPELKEQGILIYHEIIYSPWRIIYRIEGRLVFVAAVVDGRRNFEDLLFEKFLL